VSAEKCADATPIMRSYILLGLSRLLIAINVVTAISRGEEELMIMEIFEEQTFAASEAHLAGLEGTILANLPKRRNIIGNWDLMDPSRDTNIVDGVDQEMNDGEEDPGGTWRDVEGLAGDEAGDEVEFQLKIDEIYKSEEGFTPVEFDFSQITREEVLLPPIPWTKIAGYISKNFNRIIIGIYNVPGLVLLLLASILVVLCGRIAPNYRQ
jgi:hypothetical protein